MTPLRARCHAWVVALRCRFGAHELLTDVPVDDQGVRLPILRERCLHCGAVTPGLIADGPRYAVTQPGDRARLVLHNPRLRRCPCGTCEATRAARRAKRGTVTALRRSA